MRERIGSDCAASILGVSRRQVQAMAWPGEIPGAQIGAKWTFDPERLTKWRKPERRKPLKGKALRAELQRYAPRELGSQVYFIADGADAVKIGFAVNVKARLRNLQGARYRLLMLLGTIDGGPALERALHQRFARFSIRGEWFRHTAGLQSFIREILEPMGPESAP